MTLPQFPVRQCTATNRNGERCKRVPIAGGEVCTLHGGSAEHVKRRAQELLLAGVEPAIAFMLEVVRDTKRPDRVRLQAAHGILDRAGYGREHVLTVEHEHRGDYENMTEEQLAQLAAQVAAELAEAARLQREADHLRGLMVQQGPHDHLPRLPEHRIVDGEVDEPPVTVFRVSRDGEDDGPTH